MICSAFARALAAERDRYNTLFSQARRGSTRLDGAAFLAFLRRSVDPIVQAADAVAPDQVPAVVEVLYELSLDLVAQSVLGSRAAYPEMERLWPGLLAGLASHLAAAPRLLAAPLTNALYNLTTMPGCQAEQWCDGLRKVAPLCPDAATLLQAGQVAAWRCGMAHFREAALVLAPLLPPATVLVLFGGPAGDSTALLDRLAADPWLVPSQPVVNKDLRQVAVVGAFRGFGGVFIRPPRVVYADGYFHAFDGEFCWLVAADAFGATFHRAGKALPADQSCKTFTLASGTVQCRNQRRTFPELAGSTSFACSPTTLAVTLATSHSLYLIAGGTE